MADDIARLGLAIDSSQAAAGAVNLDKLGAAATKAAPAITALEKAASGVSATMPQAAKATAEATKAHVGLSTQAMAAQHSIRSMAEQLALGVPPSMILTQQLNHLAYAASGPGGLKGAFKEAGAALLGLLSPTTLVVGGLAAVAFGSYLAYESIKKTELQFGELAERSATAVQQLHAFESASAFKGVGTPDFLKNMEKLSDLSSQAEDHLGSLAALFKANGVASGSFVENLYTLADLVKNARTEAEKYRIIQQAGLEPTRAMVQYLSQGSVALREAAANAVQLNNELDERFIARAREFDEAWSRTWKEFGTAAKSAFVTAADGLDKFTQFAATPGGKILLFLAGPGAYLLSAAATALGIVGTTPSDKSGFVPGIEPKNGSLIPPTGLAGTGKPTIDPEALRLQIQLTQQYLAALGPLASVEQQVAMRENELRLARLQPGSKISDGDVARILEFTRAQALGTIAIRQQTDAANIQAATVGLGISQAAAFAAVQERINDANLRGVPLTQAQVAELQKYATALGEAAQKAALLRAESDARFQISLLGLSDTEQKVATALRQLYGDDYKSHVDDAIASQIRLNDILSTTKGIASDALSTFVSGMRQGKSATEALGDALGRIGDKLLSIAENQLISSFFGKSLGGIFGGLFGSSATPTFGPDGLAAIHHGGYGPGDPIKGRYVHPAYFDDAPRFHSGIGPGERAAIIRDDESVLTPGQMRSLAPVDAIRAPSSQVSITNHYTFTGVDSGMEMRIRAYIDSGDKRSVQQAVEHSVKAVDDTKRRYPSTYLAGVN